MCELLGLSFSQDIHPGKYFSALLSRSILHPDGWGLGCYTADSNSATIFKEPVPGYESQLASFLCKYRALQSKLFIGHIRKASRGNNIHSNTHPFTRCYGGREFIFCHNGTLHKRKLLTGLVYQPIGVTDSERAFCFLLTQMRMREIKPVRADRLDGYDSIDFKTIYEILVDINTRTAGSFNCLFSDGKYLFCYRDLKEARYLFSQRYQANISRTTSRKIDQGKNSCIEKFQNINGYVIATEPLNDGEWISFTGGQLMVFSDGELIANIS